MENNLNISNKEFIEKAINYYEKMKIHQEKYRKKKKQERNAYQKEYMKKMREDKDGEQYQKHLENQRRYYHEVYKTKLKESNNESLKK